jgi:hypothetical protein
MFFTGTGIFFANNRDLFHAEQGIYLRKIGTGRRKEMRPGVGRRLAVKGTRAAKIDAGLFEPALGE